VKSPCKRQESVVQSPHKAVFNVQCSAVVPVFDPGASTTPVNCPRLRGGRPTVIFRNSLCYKELPPLSLVYSSDKVARSQKQHISTGRAAWTTSSSGRGQWKDSVSCGTNKERWEERGLGSNEFRSYSLRAQTVKYGRMPVEIFLRRTI
jgi:hypothetical protein